jgi:hypothetical protein
VPAKHLRRFLSRPAGAAAVLAAQTLFFFRHSLFSLDWSFPWDFRGYHLPLFSAISHSLAQGQIPLWDPFTYCGSPLFANPQSQLFYLPAWPFYLAAQFLQPDLWPHLYEWLPALHVFLAGLFTFRLARSQKFPAPLLAATLFSLGAFFTSQMQHVGAVCAAAWLPLAWQSSLERRPVPLAAALALSLLAGFPAITLTVWISAFLIQPSLQFLFAVPIALLISTPMLLPALQLLPLTLAAERASQLDPGGIHWQAFLSLLNPFHIPFQDLSTKSFPGNPTFLYLFSGWSTLMLAINARNKKLWLLFTLSTLLMLGARTPIGSLFHAALPQTLKAATYLEFWLAPFSLSLALLAASSAKRYPLALAALAAAELTLASSGRIFHAIDNPRDPAVTFSSFEGAPETLQVLRDLTKGQYRIDTLNDSMNWASSAPVFRIPHAGGNDPLVLAKTQQIRRLFASPANNLPRYLTVTQTNSPVLDLLNVRYLLHWAANNEEPPQYEGLRLAARAPGHFLYENSDALPRFYIAPKWRKFESLDQLNSIQPGREVLIEAPDGSGPDGTAEILSQETLRVTCPAHCLLATSITHYPGWHAYIDQQPAKIVTVNANFLGLFVPTGKHTVTFRFQPLLLY